MLAVQMVATHFAATRALRRLKGSDMVSQQDSNGNLAVKLLRTFTAQTEALQRYRGKGQQKVTVEHVHFQTGGQAIPSQSAKPREACSDRLMTCSPHLPNMPRLIEANSDDRCAHCESARARLPEPRGPWGPGCRSPTKLHDLTRRESCAPCG